jgi:putative glutamine amidotransferase
MASPVPPTAASTLIAVAPASMMDDYREALRAAGIVAHELDHARDTPETVVTRCGGLILLGGHDVDPALYGESPHAATRIVPKPRDEYEIALARTALGHDLPVLAICRGVQLLNVALGGSLIQDIPTQVEQHLDHHPAGDAAQVAHFVDVTPGTRTAELLGDEIDANGFCAVNSRHHQAINTLGDGLKVTARAVDGVIEAVERPASRFCVGVQWHPESFWRNGRFLGLFRGFLAATQAR